MNLYSIFLKNINYNKKIITENESYSYKEIFNFIENSSSHIKKFKRSEKILLVSNNFFSYLILFFVCSSLKNSYSVNNSLSKNQILEFINLLNQV